jgi:hypothetical protein
LSTTVLPAELPGGDRQREVPRRDERHDAERLADRHGDAARDGDRVAEQPLGGARVEAEGLDDHGHLAARVADRLAGVARLEHGELLLRLGERVGQLEEQRRARVGRHRAPPRQRRLGPRDGLVGLRDTGAGDLLEHRLGGRLEDLQRPVAHSRSNPRKRSQSVTAAPKAASSTSAMLR